MQLYPVTAEDFASVYDALEEAFPPEERRDREAARALLSEGRYALLHVVEEGERLGCVGLWRLDGLLFIEHLLTYPDYRNRGVGARVLALLAEEGLPLVLEAEPPISPMATRRLGFYARCGFHRDPLAYLQPPYREGDAPTPLCLLSYPHPLSDAEAVAALLYREVYGKAWQSASTGDACCTLLVDGREAFPAILEAIAAAEKTVVINMFIWRDDAIGNRMARAVLEAADRGVSVKISVDCYGAVLEKAEECRRSFFHKKQSATEKLKARALAVFYREKGALPWQRDEESELYRAILAHPRIALDCDRHKADHSKFYIIDGRVLFLGGVNIEDKENGADREGRVYGDLMVRIEGEDAVRAFLARREGVPLGGDLLFPMNRKETSLFEMEEHYLSLIDAARERLLIVMAYLSPLPRFLDAIVRAHKRGVRVTVMIPARANYQNDTNRKTVARLLALTDGGIEVRLSPKMLHTKLLATEAAISFGSTNITKKAFSQLDELNLTVKNTASPFCRALTAAMERELAAATPVGVGEVPYARLRAFFEGFLV